MLIIDGSQGEGGGQVLRTSLGLSLVTGTPFRIDRIRAGRAKPGLMRQHLTSVLAAAKVSGAQVEGAEVGSQALTFVPGRVMPGNYAFAVGTAGSATLVLQTVLPGLLLADAPSTLTLEGGTHNSMAPSFDFLAQAFAPLVAKLGPRLDLKLTHPGFYPAGGGLFTATVTPAPTTRIELFSRGSVIGHAATALSCQVPPDVPRRELEALGARLGWSPDVLHTRTISRRGPGNVLWASLAYEHVTEVVTAFGERRVSAEAIAASVAEDVERYLATDAPVGEHLADQLLLLLAVGRGGAFRTLAPTAHTRTQAAVIEAFRVARVRLHDEGARTWRVDVER
jgi:RNA 3'-terminal phosphate cyclase (ATP)